MDGSIEVSSKLGEGSIFTIYLPATITITSKIEEETYQFPIIARPKKVMPVKETLNTDSPKPFILVVEDNHDFCKYLVSTLGEDYTLVFRHNGEKALEYLKKKQIPDLIITDWMMPNMDGMELVKELKSSDAYCQIPVLMLTSRNLTADKLKMLRIGIDDYLVKTIEPEILLSRIQELINKYQIHSGTLNSSIEMTQFEIEKYTKLNVEDQNWLMELEETIKPLIGDFDLNVDKLAKLNNIHSRKLYRKIKAVTGFTPMKYIQEIRLWEARRLLEINTYQSVKAVGLSVGYKDLGYFSKKFKERFGESPSTYLCLHQYSDQKIKDEEGILLSLD